MRLHRPIWGWECRTCKEAALELSEERIVCEVFFRMWCSEDEVKAKIAQWQASTDVEQTTALTCRIRSSSRQWLTDVVHGDPDVAEVTFIRTERTRQ
jgi:hypothetical protein